jgi:3-hydroxyisobutyrate dehydrogenase
MIERIAFIGLGNMGYPMAGHLAEAGYALSVYNRSPDKAARWVEEHGGRAAQRPAAAAGGADIVLACLGGDEDVREVALGEGGAFPAMRPGALFVDHTTTSAALARELAGAADERGLLFADAPIAGGIKGARAGRLSVMVGASEAAFSLAEPVLRRYAAGIEHMGPPGAGQLTKMANQICATGIIQSLAEGLAFAQRAGLDDGKVIEVLAKGSAGSWQIGNRATAMQRRDFNAGGTVALLHKDLGLCLDEARRLGVALPVADLVRGFYGEIVKQDLGELDAAALIGRLEGSLKRMGS